MTNLSDEELCKDALLTHARGCGYEASAERGDRKAPRPDYVFWLDGEEYAVEVTKVMDSLDLPDDQSIGRAVVEAGLSQLAAEITKRAKQESLPIGRVQLSKPGKVIADFWKKRSKIVDDVIAFLREGAGMTEPRRQKIVLDGYGDEWITVHHSPTMRPFVEVGGWEIEYEEEIAPYVRELMEERIAEKRRRLEGETRPKVLLLHNCCPAVSSAHYQEAFCGIDATDFSAVVVVHAPNQVTQLAWLVPPARASA